MFNLFKKKVSETNVVSNSLYPEIVRDIHSQFLNAGDKILHEAKCLLKELEDKDLSKGKRLSAIGFHKTQEAKSVSETELQLVLNKTIAESVLYFQNNYPFNKFITEQQVKHICEKYGLVCGDISMYTGFVPENKLKQIESFKLNDADCIEKTQCYYNGRWQDITNEKAYELIQWRKEDYKNPSSSHKSDYWCSEDFKVVIKEGLQICAPLKDMDIPNNKRVEGHKIIHIPDPVVLQPVNGGYLIIAAWGDEASDEIVVNTMDN